MAQELERLLLKIEADTAGLRSALRDMDSAVDKSERNVTSKLAKIDNKFSTLGTSVAGSLRGMAASVASIAALHTVFETGGNMQRAADNVGLTAERYQELAAAALDAGVSTQQFDAAMTKFAASVSEARQHTGGFYEFLRGQAPALLAQIQGSRDVAEAMGFVADAVSRLGSAEDRALVVKQAYGEGVISLVRALEGGRAGLEAKAEAARKLNAIVSNESVKTVSDYEKEIKKLGNTVYSYGVTALGSFIDWIKQLDTRLEEQRQSLGKTGDAIKGIFKGADPAPDSDAFFNRLEEAQKSGWSRLEKQAVGAWQTIVNAPTKLQIDPRKLYPGADAISALRMQAAEASGRDLEAVTMAYNQELEKFRRMLEDKTITEKQYSEARALLGETMQSKIAAVYEKETHYVRELANEFKSGLQGSVNSVFDSIINGSFNAADALRNLVSEFARLATQAAITKPLVDYLFGNSGSSGVATGWLSQAFGGIASSFGGGGGWSTTAIPARAHGGPMSMGQAYIAGERGPELIVPNTAAQAMPSWAMGKSGGGAGAVYNIDARGAEAGVEQRIYATLAKIERERANPIVAGREFSSRFPTRR